MLPLAHLPKQENHSTHTVSTSPCVGVTLTFTTTTWRPGPAAGLNVLRGHVLRKLFVDVTAGIALTAAPGVVEI